MARKLWLAALVPLTVVVWAACSSDDKDGDDGDDGGPEETVTETIGSAGGELSLSGASLVIPAGALPGDTEISISRLSDDAPAGYAAQSELYELGPDGLEFTLPVSLTLEFEGAGSGLAVFLTAKSGTGYEKISGTVTGQTITAAISHFSTAFAGKTQGAQTGTAYTLDEVEQKLPDAYCNVLTACGATSTVAGCKTWLADMSTYGDATFASIQQTREGVTAGKVTFDGTKARTCLDALSAMTACPSSTPPEEYHAGVFIDAARATVPECAGVFTGTVATEGACGNHDHCAPGLFCNNVSTKTCPGACKPKKKVDEAVSPGELCEEGLYPYGNSKCLAPVAAGLSCAPISPSSAQQTCTGGNYCDTTTNVCKPALAADAQCVGRNQCSPGHICVFPPSSQLGTCKPLLDPPGTCDNANRCTFDNVCWVTASGSSATGTCSARVDSGQACTQSYHCKPGFYCTGNNTTPGTCAAVKAENAACSGFFECGSTLFCDDSGPSPTNTCRPKRDEGDACSSSSQCKNGLDCTNSECKPFDCAVP